MQEVRTISKLNDSVRGWSPVLTSHLLILSFKKLNATVFISEFFRQSKELATKPCVFISIGGYVPLSTTPDPDKCIRLSALLRYL